jgi:hypothetical protein
VPKPLTRSEVDALAADLRSMLAKIETGELEATTAMLYRLQGAVGVLEVIAGRAARFELE